MADILSFGTISFEATQKMELLDKFEELYNDDGFAIFQSKKTYHSDDEAYNPFDYKLIIRARFDDAVEHSVDKTEVYENMLESGINVDMVRKYMGDETADHMQDYCESHGLL